MNKLAVFLLFGSSLVLAQGPFSKVAPDKKAEDAFQNIQVLKGDPSTSVRGDMEFFNTALGMKCETCHDIQAFDKDTKNPKKTAREMITMTRELNKTAFRGMPRVNCYTCHQGHNRPTGTPEIPALVSTAPVMARFQQQGGPGGPPPGGAPAGGPPQGMGPGGGGPQGPPLQPGPKGDDIVTKYQTAIGGADKLGALKSVVMKGSETMPDGKSAPFTLRIASGKILSEAGPVKEGWNGKEAWGMSAAGPAAYHVGDELQPLLEHEADLYPGSKLMAPGGLRAFGAMKLGAHDVIVMMPSQRTPTNDRLYFEKGSGLLVRQAYTVNTGMGPLPTQIDYEDYRSVPGLGVKMPFKIIYSRPLQSWTLTVSSVEANGKVDDAVFDPAKP